MRDHSTFLSARLMTIPPFDLSGHFFARDECLFEAVNIGDTLIRTSAHLCTCCNEKRSLFFLLVFIVHEWFVWFLFFSSFLSNQKMRVEVFICGC